MVSLAPMTKATSLLAAAALASCAGPAWSLDADSPSMAALAVSSDAADMDDAERRYAEAVRRFEAGDPEGGRAELKQAFDAVIENLDDDALPASLHAEFTAMLDKIRGWRSPQEEGEAALGLDVSLDTGAARMAALALDEDNPVVQKFIEIYAKGRPRTVEEALARSGRYRDMILGELKTKGLPAELLYLVMAESEYKYGAVSRSGAAGLWQFMPQTARKYGLEVSYWIDERFDPEKSTRAAARYLSDLYRWFGDWGLAIAAYNRGEGGLGRDMQSSRSADFDSLSGRKALPAETHQYVPKFTACALIGSDPAKYGLHPRYEKPEEYDTVSLPRDLDLGVAARCAGATETELRRLNPQLRAWCTPKNRPGFMLRLPQGATSLFAANLARTADWNPGPTMVRYRVRRGDSLSRIARLNRTTTRSILQTNKIQKARLIRPGMVLLIRPGHASRRKSVN